MKRRTQTIVFSVLFGPPLLFAVYVLAIHYSRPVKLLPIDAGSPAAAYVQEIKDRRMGRGPKVCNSQAPGLTDAQKRECWRKWEEYVRIAPDRSAELKLEKAPYTIEILEGCHELWLEPKGSQRRRIFKLMEGDPGSGLSFNWGWSADSKAIFIYGATGGINCRGNGYREFAAIYTVADEKAWEVWPLN